MEKVIHSDLLFEEFLSKSRYEGPLTGHRKEGHDLKYHLVWTTKYWYQVLGGDVGQRCRRLFREIEISKEVQICVGSVNRDCLDMLIDILPGYLGRIVSEGKEYTSIVNGISVVKEAILGPKSVSQRLLFCIE